MRTPACVLLLVFSASSLHAQSAVGRAYRKALEGGPLTLYAFLVRMPKGADLHIHISGAVYAETFIRDAGEDGLCIDTVALAFAKPPCVRGLVPATDLSGNISSPNQSFNQSLYDKLVDSFSMRSFVPSSGWSGHDQFFATFDRFGGLSKSHLGEWIDEIAARAAAQNEQYLELMQTPTFTNAKKLGWEAGWSKDQSKDQSKDLSKDLSKELTSPGVGPEDFARLRRHLLDRGLRDEVPVDQATVRDAEAARLRIEHCGTPEATPACRVEIRYIYQVLRANPPQQVFAQTLLGFETVKASMEADMEAGKTGETGGGFVGINFVQPEDSFLAMRDYTLQMKMLDYLHSVYPRVHISLHAGELAPGMVPPAGLRFHIRQAVELGHAERIGHGVDIMYEDDPWGLLHEMARKHIMVEVNLTSNAAILGIEGDEHPFPIYRAEHVPVALSTDDEGVSRIDLTHEYAMAAEEYHLSYADLKEMARTGMEHDFLPGTSLWARPDDFYEPAAACRGQLLGGDHPSRECKEFLDSSQKATEQWELERRFRAFEAKF